jgi:hypothetical protein
MAGEKNDKKNSKNESPLFPTGESLVEVQFVDFETSAQKGTPTVTFKLTGSAGPCKGQQIRNRCYITDTSLWKLEDFAIACGIDAETTVNQAKEKSTDLLEAFIGAKVKIIVKADNYTDKEGIEREGREIIAVESIHQNIREYMERRRKARKSNGVLREAQPLIGRGATKPAAAKPANDKPPAQARKPAPVDTDNIPF